MENEAPNAWQSLAGQGIFRGRGAPGKVVFLFPGQGSQYPNMLRDLCAVEPLAADTFREADQVMTPILGRPLTSYIFVNEDPASIKEAEEALKNTVITQPAVLTANVALLRLMEKFGFKPDLVAGHSLGEYAALVAAGVLTFPAALEVVSNRGRAMAKVSLDDNGCMAAVSAPLPEIERILKTVEGYVVIANINSPVQSVIGGATVAVDAAIAALTAAGFQAVKIPVSHAFHTQIVAPASPELREAIGRKDIRSPRIPVIANVNGEPYPTTREEVLDILGRQVASPVQFVHSMETLYASGGRIFVEIGPKRVLNALAVDNLKDHSDVTMLATNHPRKGSLTSFNEALAGLYAAGVIPQLESQAHSDGSQPATLTPKAVQTAAPEPAAAAQPPAKKNGAGPAYDEIKSVILKEVSEKTGYPVEMLDLDLDLEADLGIDTVKQAELFVTLSENYGLPRPESLRLADYNTLAKVIGFIQGGMAEHTPAIPANPLPAPAGPRPDGGQPAPVKSEAAPAAPAPASDGGDDDVRQVVLAMVSEKTGYPVEMLDLDLDLEADLGVDTVKQAELFLALRERYTIPRPDDLRLSDYNTLAKIIRFFANPGLAGRGQ